jgi:hypothetical protein
MKKINKILFFLLVFLILCPVNIAFAEPVSVLPKNSLPATLIFTRNNPTSAWTGTYTGPTNKPVTANLSDSYVQAGVSKLPAGSFNTSNNGNTITITGQENIDNFSTNVQEKIDQTFANTKEGEPNIADKIGNFFLYIFSLSFYLASLLIGFLIDFSSRLIDFGFGATKLASSKTVQEGWTFTRDILNFIFILILLAISFSTIAGLETFSMRKTLPRLLFAALLVNFSLAISGAFLQVANVMTVTIADSVLPSTPEACQAKETNGNKAIGCRLAVGLTSAGQIGQLYTYKNSDWVEYYTGQKTQILQPGGTAADVMDFSNVTSQDFKTYLMVVLKSATSVVMLGVFAIAFIFLGILIFVRLIALIILLILAPVPYVFGLIPKAQKYSDEWWGKFINYTFFLPIATFFLAIAIRILNRTTAGTTSLVGQFWPDGTLATSGAGGTFNGLVGSLVDVVFVSIFIFGAVYVARSLSIFGASGALGVAKGTVFGAGKLGMMPARLVGGATVGGIKKGGGATARGLGSLPVIAGGVRGARSAGRFAQRMYSGQEASAQVSEQQKAVKHMTDDQLKDAMTRGNAGAAAELMDRGELKSDEDFAKAKKLIPKNTQMGEKLKEAHQVKSPVSANVSSLDTATLGNITGGKLTDDEKDAIIAQAAKTSKAASRMKDEDIGKNPMQIRALLQAAKRQVDKGELNQNNLAISLTPAKIKAYAERLDTAGQSELEDLVKKLPGLTNAQKAAGKRQGYTIP